MRKSRTYKYIPWFCCLIVLLGGNVLSSTGQKASVFDVEQVKIRYNTASAPIQESQTFLLSEDFASEKAPLFGPAKGYKSPTKAFLLSLAVPGLGQYYYGSRIKPFIFFGVEVVSWAYYFNWHNEGDDLTADYEAFNLAHWSRDDYEQKYLLWVYGVTSDSELPTGTRGITHNLPDELTQQFFEMTGKYDQFSWGWDDAILNDRVLDDFSASDPPDTVIGAANTPYSARRFQYETMRNDANNAYDRATRMVFVSMANRLLSAFEALFTTKKNNRNLRLSSDEFSRVKIRAKLKSYYTKRDTPFVTVTYKF